MKKQTIIWIIILLVSIVYVRGESCTSTDSNLYAWYHFDNIAANGESSSLVKDYATFGRDLSIYAGSPTLIDGIYNLSTQTSEDSSSWVSGDFGLSSPSFTVCEWIKPYDYSGPYNILTLTEDNIPTGELIGGFMYAPSNQQILFESSGIITQHLRLSSINSVPLNVWSYVCGVSQWTSETVIAKNTGEFITDGGFSGNADNWNLGSGWSYGDNNIIFTPPDSGSLTQNDPLNLTSGGFYTVSFYMNSSVGTIDVCLGSGTCETYSAGTGTLSFIGGWYNGDGNIISFIPSGDFDGTISDVSVKEAYNTFVSLSITNKIYINGVEDTYDCVDAPCVDTADGLSVGGVTSIIIGGYSGPANFSLDEFKMYNYPLMAPEILSLYNNQGYCEYTVTPPYISPIINGTNVVGWDELTNGSIVQAAFDALDKPLSPHGEGGYLLLGFFVVLSIVIVVTSTVEISFILGMMFLAIFAVAQWINVFSRGIIIAILVFELGAILYKNFFKYN